MDLRHLSQFHTHRKGLGLKNGFVYPFVSLWRPKLFVGVRHSTALAYMAGHRHAVFIARSIDPSANLLGNSARSDTVQKSLVVKKTRTHMFSSHCNHVKKYPKLMTMVWESSSTDGYPLKRCSTSTGNQGVIQVTQ